MALSRYLSERSVRGRLDPSGHAWPAQLGDDPAPVGDEHGFAALDFPQDSAQMGLQFPHADGSHGSNVVTGDYIDKVRATPGTGPVSNPADSLRWTRSAFTLAPMIDLWGAGPGRWSIVRSIQRSWFRTAGCGVGGASARVPRAKAPVVSVRLLASNLLGGTSGASGAAGGAILAKSGERHPILHGHPALA